MVYKLNPFHQAVWRTPTTLQIGLDSRHVVLNNVSSAEERFVDALYFGIAPNQVEAIAKQVKLSPPDALRLLQTLRPLLERKAPASAKRPNPGEPLNYAAALPEIMAASLEHGTDGAAVLLERGRRAIYIETLDATGLLLLQTLANSSVGTIVTQDAAKVSIEDVGPLAYPHGLVGHQRIAAANLMLQASWPSTRLVSAIRTRDSKLNNIDVAILTANLTTSTQTIAKWNSRQVPQLEIRFEAGGLKVSKVVIPGVTPCLICRELTDHFGNAELAAVDAQLIGAEVSFGSATSRLLGVTLASQNILAWLDSVGGFGQGVTTNYSVAIAGSSGGTTATTLSTRNWGYNVGCSCRMMASEIAEAS